MIDDPALQALGLVIDTAPPLLDARRPWIMAYQVAASADDEAPRHVAFAGIELVRFEIARAAAGHEPAPIDAAGRAWTRAIDALVRLPDDTELWHVVATRRHVGTDGARLRAGWLAVGRASSPFEAARMAERTASAALEILASTHEFATLSAVADAAGLIDLLRPMAAPFVVAIRRARWSPPLAVWRSDARSEGLPSGGVLLPWSRPRGEDAAERPAWAPLAEAIANEPDDAAFVVRFAPLARPPRAVEVAAARDVASLAGAFEALAGARMHVVPAERITELALAHLRVARDVALRVQVLLATWRGQARGLAATAMGALVSVEPTPPGTSVAIPPTPLQVAPLTPDEAWGPLDASHDPELCVAPDDAWPLVRTCEPPHDERSPLPCGRGRHHPVRAITTAGLILGDALDRGSRRAVHLTEEDRLRHVYCVGQTGTGKSTLLLHMIRQDLEAGHGVTVIDPHGALVEAVLDQVPRARAEDVVLIDAADAGRSVALNPLSYAGDGAHYLAFRDRTIDDLYDTFDHLYDLRATGGPIFEQYFRLFASLLIGTSRPGDYAPILPMMEVLLARPQLAVAMAKRAARVDPLPLALLRNIVSASGESALKNMVPYVVSKLNRFYQPVSARRMLCQDDCLDFDALVRDRRIVLLSLTRAAIGAPAAALVARQVILRLWLAAMARGTAAEHPVHYVYADEFHAFASEGFAALLAEARKFRLGLVLAHQYTSQLTPQRDAGRASVLDAVLGNVGTVIAFRVGALDAELLEPALAPRATAHDVVGLPNHTALIRSSGALGGTPFTLFTRPPPSPRHALAAAIRQLSRLKHGRDCDLVDAAFRASMAGFTQLGKPPAPSASGDDDDDDANASLEDPAAS